MPLWSWNDLTFAPNILWKLICIHDFLDGGFGLSLKLGKNGNWKLHFLVWQREFHGDVRYHYVFLLVWGETKRKSRFLSLSRYIIWKSCWFPKHYCFIECTQWTRHPLLEIESSRGVSVDYTKCQGKQNCQTIKSCLSLTTDCHHHSTYCSNRRAWTWVQLKLFLKLESA